MPSQEERMIELLALRSEVRILKEEKAVWQGKAENLAHQLLDIEDAAKQARRDMEK